MGAILGIEKKKKKNATADCSSVTEDRTFCVIEGKIKECIMKKFNNSETCVCNKSNFTRLLIIL